MELTFDSFYRKCITVREEVSSFKTSLHHKSIQLQQTAESLEKVSSTCISKV